MRRKNSLVFGIYFVAVACLMVGTKTEAAVEYTVTDLGILPGMLASSAWGVSSDGSVVVGGNDGASGSKAFRWTSGDGMVGLDASNSYSWAYDVNSDGSVVVGVSEGKAFRWTSGNGLVGLGTVPDDSYSSAYGISSNGSVIVGYSGSASVNEAFRWTSGSGMVGLGALPGYNDSRAYGVSGEGSVVVG